VSFGEFVQLLGYALCVMWLVVVVGVVVLVVRDAWGERGAVARARAARLRASAQRAADAERWPWEQLG
jgi:citrate lyase gamma subunit